MISKTNGFLFDIEEQEVQADVAVADGGASYEPLESNSAANLYADFYAALRRLREDYHRIGSFDDANAKLDEMCKLLAAKTLDVRFGGAEKLTAASILARIPKGIEAPEGIAKAIRSAYQEVVGRCAIDMRAFSGDTDLKIKEDDDEFAAALIPVIDSLPVETTEDKKTWAFDGLNEAFGHFIQDNFRNRKEDAQYMTPAEVVSAMVDVAIEDIRLDSELESAKRKLVVADPTCGVGSFLAAMHRHSTRTAFRKKSLADYLTLVGQDKVERMSRLAAVNLQVFAESDATITQGNSVIGKSRLNDWQGKLDLILTNPPFGATFESKSILLHTSESDLPVIHRLAASGDLPVSLDSEYILLDKELAMLRPGGRMLMVVPDHVVSAGGFAERFRLELLKRNQLVGVIDLPTEAFAQAGTRTKCSVIYLRRMDGANRELSSHVFMASVEDLGFKVVMRSGASVKKHTGENQMPRVIASYNAFRETTDQSADIIVLGDDPSVAAVSTGQLLNNRWTAGFYRTSRLKAVRQIEAGNFEAMRLLDIATITDEGRERTLADENNRCISVLHVDANGCLDLEAIESYRPATACVRCKPGDILLSKINPRIPRLTIVPELTFNTACSTEFAIIQTQCHLDEWELLLLLKSEVVQSQIKTLTSGTSSSHNRIKTRDLNAVYVPIPKRRSKEEIRLQGLARQLQDATERQYASITLLRKAHGEIDRFFDN